MQETQETRVWSLGWEDLLEEEMATHSSILAWKIPWSEEPCRLQSVGLQRVRQDWAHTHTANMTLWFVLYCCSVAQFCPTFCNPVDIRLTFLHYLLEFAQTHVHRVDDVILLSHPLLPPSPSALNLLPQHQGLFQWVSSSNQMVKVSEFQLWYQSFQWIFMVDFL